MHKLRRQATMDRAPGQEGSDRGVQAVYLVSSDCEVKFPGNGCPCPLPPPYPRHCEIWGASRPVK